MEIRPKFPKHRLHDPKRRAELAVYRELEASTTLGVAFYEPRFGPYTRGLDFGVWLEGIGRFAIEDKGGHHSVEGRPGGCPPPPASRKSTLRRCRHGTGPWPSGTASR